MALDGNVLLSSYSSEYFHAKRSRWLDWIRGTLDKS